MIYPVILCGGHGTRLWPISRENLPKQFIGFASKTSLLQNSVNRIKSLPGIGMLYILTNHTQRFLAEEQLAAIGVKSAEIILEPAAKSTSPAITLAALHLESRDPDAVMLVLSSDNEITHPHRFRKLLMGASRLAKKNNKFLLFGSEAVYPETGYGYIKPGSVIDSDESNVEICEIEKFIEKPSELEATACIKAGYQWNSGIFVLPVKLYLEEMQIHAPKILEACRASMKAGHQALSTHSHYSIVHVDHKEFEKCPTDSIDYALLEKTNKYALVKTKIGWSDVGSWGSVYSIQKKDSDGNVIKADSCVSINNHNVQVYSNNKDKLIAAVNLDNITIVDSEDAVLILNTESSQDVKKIINTLRSNHMDNFLSNATIHRTWGRYSVLLKQNSFVVKRIFLSPGRTYASKGSLKSRHFITVKGDVTLISKSTVSAFKEGNSFSYDEKGSYKIRNLSKSETAEFIKIEF